MKRLFCSALFAPATMLFSCAPAGAAPAHTLDIVSRVAKFEKFYAEAAKAPDEPARWALWQKDYGIAGVPPGPDGLKMARKLLDAAWGKYPALMPKLSALSAAAEADTRALFAKDNAILKTAGVPIHSRVVLYVGQFDGNAFTVPPMGGKPATVVMPVENSNLKIALAHELAHSIHMQLAGVKASFGAPVGETMFLEGLAMRTAQEAVPGLPDAAYTEMPGDRGWLQQCEAKKIAVLRGIVPDLGKSGSAIAMKYTFGQGNTGMQRELYCAAWIVMGRMLTSGRALGELARVPEAGMVDTIRTAMKAD
jgi:hypothetical protein